MDLARPCVSSLSLTELDNKVSILWQEHDALDEEVVNLRKKTDDVEQRMHQIATEALELRKHMRALTPDSLEDVKALLRVIEEDAYHLSLLEGGDEQMIASILLMLKSVQKFL